MIDHSNVSATKAKNIAIPAMWRGSPYSYADMDDESDEWPSTFFLDTLALARCQRLVYHTR
ncbi:hypothetical protein K402DRAFT_424811 [Aulographum hederae CBS 113979]|uniref:Uncharacterized protein n=1 Tax=Aulographum hederae CBS 113979 TaxID=1176131 RepID=A0A6G1GMD8_9PEZI|nr:hypothetical protein K402DRAFT_424811 [Aulographum hederae CBS 113979]